MSNIPDNQEISTQGGPGVQADDKLRFIIGGVDYEQIYVGSDLLEAMEKKKEMKHLRGITETSTMLSFSGAVQEIDWDPDLLKSIVWLAFPDEEKMSVDKLCSPIICMIAAGYGAPIPVKWASMGDICIHTWMNTAGWIADEYCLGHEFLKKGTHSELFSDGQKYSWHGIAELRARTRPDFFDKLNSGEYQSMADLFIFGDQTSLKNENTPALDTTPKDTQASPSVAKSETSSEPNQPKSNDSDFWSTKMHVPTKHNERKMELPEISDRETEAIKMIKFLYARGQLISSGVAVAYLLTRLVAKSSSHVVNQGNNFATLFSRYSLDIDPGTKMVFDLQAIDSIRASVVNFQSTVAVYLWSVEELMIKKKIMPPTAAQIQLKALMEIRLSYYGMVLPALGLWDADKLGISSENLAALSSCDKTFVSCSTYLDFISRLEFPENRKLAKVRGTDNKKQINPTGVFKYARLFDQNFMTSLSAAKNQCLTFLWMFIQRRLTGPTDPSAVRESDMAFHGLSDTTIAMLGDMGQRIINGIKGCETLAVVPSLDSGPAIAAKRKMIEEALRSQGADTRFVARMAATQNMLPTVTEIPAPSATTTVQKTSRPTLNDILGAYKSKK